MIRSPTFFNSRVESDRISAIFCDLSIIIEGNLEKSQVFCKGIVLNDQYLVLWSVFWCDKGGVWSNHYVISGGST